MTRVQYATVSADAAGSVNLAFSGANTAGNTLVVFLCSYYGDSTFSGVACADTLGNTYPTSPAKIIDSSTEAAASVSEACFYVQNCLGGSNTVQITGLASAYVQMTIIEYDGMEAASFDGAAQFRYAAGSHGGASTTAIDSGTVTPTTGSRLLVAQTHAIATGLSVSGFTGTKVAEFSGSFMTMTVVERTVSALGGGFFFAGNWSAAQVNVPAMVAAFKIAAPIPAKVDRVDYRKFPKTFMRRGLTR